jgi:hypothetical protein
VAGSNITWPTVVTAVVALYGAALSTLNYLASRREKSRRVKVELSLGFLAHGPTLSPTMLFIVASNIGTLPVTLSSSGIRLPNGRQAICPLPNTDVRFPHELQGGKDCRIWIDAREFADTLRREGLSGKVRLTGFYLDQTGVRHKSKPFKFDADSFLRH